MGAGSYRSVPTVPCRKVCRLVNVAWPNWLSARFSFDCSRWNQTPDAELMPALGKRHAILIGEQIARDVQIAAVVAARQAQLRGGIRRRAAAHHHRADGCPARKPGRLAAGVPGVGSPVKK